MQASRGLWLILIIAAVWRGWQIAGEYHFFNSDEAIIGLMARHILEGHPIPTFFYGQNYMGSFGAMLVALGFVVAGQSVQTIRLVQGLLMLIGVGTSYLLARRITGSPRVGLMTAFLMAIPVPMAMFYTSVALGDYNELVILSNLVGLFAWKVTVEGSRRGWDWALLGGFIGLGWWSYAGIITAAVVAGMLGLAHFRGSLWRLYLLAAVAFFIGSAPWWFYNVQHEWDALTGMMATGSDNDNPVFENLTTTPFISIRDFYLTVIAASGLYGFRFPREGTLESGWHVWLAGGVYCILIARSITRWRYALPSPARSHWLTPTRWIGLNFAVLIFIFIFSSIYDVTGRYLLPVWMPAMLGVALMIAHIRMQALAAGMLASLLVFHAGTTLKDFMVEREARQREALTDEAVMAWLAEHDFRYGYAPFWESFRLTFLSREHLIFDSSLPVDARGKIFNRYPPYSRTVQAEGGQFWMTRDQPCLDAAIDYLFAEANVTYQVQVIDDYRILYDFSASVTPYEFELDTRPLEEYPFYPSLAACAE